MLQRRRGGSGGWRRTREGEKKHSRLVSLSFATASFSFSTERLSPVSTSGV